jgi:hypothetical protein
MTGNPDITEFDRLSRSDAYNIAMQPVSDHEPDAADKDFFQPLRFELEHQIAGYIYDFPKGSIGTPLHPDEVRGLVNAMRLFLVEPYWEEVNICNTREESLTGIGVKRKCVTMAEDDDYVLVYDPVDEQYHLAWRSERGLGTWGICGDGVECFIAR